MSTAADARFWDRWSRRYARAAISDPGGYERTLARAAACLQPGDHVLELGCGTGSTALRLAGGVADYLATDLSPGMIAIAGEKLAASPVAGLRFRCATAAAVAAEGARFDVVLAFNVLHLLRDLEATLRAVHAMLPPGGLFLSKTPCLREMTPLVRLALVPALRAVRLAPHVEALDEAMLTRAIAAAGFEIEAVERHATKGRDMRPVVLARRV
jgi:2-polyprenyl-3-methyl-5-hydroxy-6-metoxy-1,4-benzoquinol methylase